MTDKTDKSFSGRYAEIAPKPPQGAVDLRALFPEKVEIELDVGSGRGMFLFERGRACPEIGLLGLEKNAKWATIVSQRCRREALDNVTVMAGDARQILPRMVPDGAVKRVFLHFPDPWWKKRHEKRRLVDEPMIAQIARLLSPAGELFLQTDVQERALAYLDRFRACGEFRFTTDHGFVQANPYGARSNREKRAEQDGLPVYRILAVRK